MSEAIIGRPTRLADPQAVQWLLKTADFVVLLIATMVVFLGSWIPAHAASLVGFLALEVALGSVVMMAWLGLYGLDVLLVPRRAIMSALIATVGLAAVVFVSTHLGLFALEPWWVSGWVGLCGPYFILTRVAAFAWARPKAAAGAFRQRVAVVGWGPEAEQALRLLDGADPLRLHVVGLFDDRTGQAGAMSDLVAAAQSGSLDLVVVAIPMTSEDRLLQTLKRLWPLPVDIRISRQAADLKLSPRAYGYLGKLALLSVFDRPLKGRRWGKDQLERALAALLLVIALPILVVVALAIRLESRGPVLAREPRYGFDGTAIEVYRFRCSRLEARGGGTTRVGAALRKLGLAGLPQLVNVLKGDLSLVGPRPHVEAGRAGASLYQQVIDGYFARHKVKPGLTGWAQINGWPQDVDVAETIGGQAKHDLEYVDRWSLLFDLYILFKAPFALLRNRAAL
jgi:lipopolysaccharide/colanic/teichoic acid biosynthesis glycosyltransferase